MGHSLQREVKAKDDPCFLDGDVFVALAHQWSQHYIKGDLLERPRFVGGVYGAGVEYAWFALEADFVSGFLYNERGMATRIEKGICSDVPLGFRTVIGTI